MELRSRLVATEVRHRGVESIFCATPPLESVRALITKLTCEDPTSSSDPWKVALADVSRAHFYAPAIVVGHLMQPASTASPADMLASLRAPLPEA